MTQPDLSSLLQSSLGGLESAGLQAAGGLASAGLAAGVGALGSAAGIPLARAATTPAHAATAIAASAPKVAPDPFGIHPGMTWKPPAPGQAASTGYVAPPTGYKGAPAAAANAQTPAQATTAIAASAPGAGPVDMFMAMPMGEKAAIVAGGALGVVLLAKVFGK